jgi:hypothetical protein
MKIVKTLLLAAIAATLVVPQISVAQTSRSEAGALASILSRLTPNEGKALLKGLRRLEEGTSNEVMSQRNAWDFMLRTADADDRSVLTDLWKNAGSFDRESIAILARDAVMNGLDDDGSKRTLAMFSDERMAMTANSPMGMVMVPDRVILATLVRKLSDANGKELERVVAKLEKAAQGNFENYGYYNTQKILVDNLSDGGRAAFVSEWKTLDIADREAILSIVRDAMFGGLDDL